MNYLKRMFALQRADLWSCGAVLYAMVSSLLYLPLIIAAQEFLVGTLPCVQQ